MGTFHLAGVRPKIKPSRYGCRIYNACQAHPVRPPLFDNWLEKRSKKTTLAPVMRPRLPTGRSPIARIRPALRPVLPLLVVASAVALAAGCRTPPPPPQVDLSEPGWRLRRGQAVWKPASHRPELAGELLIASHPDGRGFIEFSKTPFPLVVAGFSGQAWQIQFGSGRRRLTGRGEPPAKSAWLLLPRALTGAAPPAGWRFLPSDPGSWLLENAQTGESLRGYLRP